jgi:hypothetical protein
MVFQPKENTSYDAPAVGLLSLKYHVLTINFNKITGLTEKNVTEDPENLRLKNFSTRSLNLQPVQIMKATFMHLIKHLKYKMKCPAKVH